MNILPVISKDKIGKIEDNREYHEPRNWKLTRAIFFNLGNIQNPGDPVIFNYHKNIKSAKVIIGNKTYTFDVQNRGYKKLLTRHDRPITYKTLIRSKFPDNFLLELSQKK